MKNRGTLTLGVTAILIASLFAGSVTFAYFSDTETSTGNTFTAGTLDVKIRNGGYSYQDDIEWVWYESDIKPGYEKSRSFDFKNYGSIWIDHMEITCDYTVIEEDPQTESDTDPNTDTNPDSMASEFTITSLWMYKDGIGDTDILPLLDDWNGNTRKDLEDLKKAGIDNLSLVPDPNQVGYTTVDMTLRFESGAGNDFQGDTLVLTMIFTFNQHPSQ